MWETARRLLRQIWVPAPENVPPDLFDRPTGDYEDFMEGSALRWGKHRGKEGICQTVERIILWTDAEWEKWLIDTLPALAEPWLELESSALHYLTGAATYALKCEPGSGFGYLPMPVVRSRPYQDGTVVLDHPGLQEGLDIDDEHARLRRMISEFKERLQT